MPISIVIPNAWTANTRLSASMPKDRIVLSAAKAMARVVTGFLAPEVSLQNTE